jgi:hypothetical protein
MFRGALAIRLLLPAVEIEEAILYISGLQPGVCKPPRVREQVSGGKRKHFTGYVKLKNRKTLINTEY